MKQKKGGFLTKKIISNDSFIGSIYKKGFFSWKTLFFSIFKMKQTMTFICCTQDQEEPDN